MTQHQDPTPAGQQQTVSSRRTARCFRIVAGATVVLAATALLTGCGDKKSGAAAPQSVKGSAAPASGDATADQSQSGSSTPTASSKSDGGTASASASRDTGTGTPASESAGSGRCHTSGLKVAVGPNHPGAGQENFALVLTNRSGHSCTVHGYPGMAFVNSKGQEVSVNPERTGGTKNTVKLAPGKSAWAALSFSNPEMTGVTTVTPAAVEITPPDETASLKVAWSGGPVTNTGKASVPKVGPFSAGTGA
ncbi:DUF4232 domain-containing protein [Streptomyces sp. NPDC051320]|uniref:DUF4232 domain-containing protein n=1 Tax=Streptomyces sp. NPDC051320 TaxID=3154644 RepID=UPI003418F69B